VRYSPLIADEAKKRKQSVAGSWRMDETCIKVKGQWTYLYRAIDKYVNTADFMLSEHRDKVAPTAFFKQAIDHNRLPSKVVIDKSGANNAGLENINTLIFLSRLLCFINILKVKYLNNIVEQDHRFIKKITKPLHTDKLKNRKNSYGNHPIYLCHSRLRWVNFKSALVGHYCIGGNT
jgi:putative transposase